MMYKNHKLHFKHASEGPSRSRIQPTFSGMIFKLVMFLTLLLNYVSTSDTQQAEPLIPRSPTPSDSPLTQGTQDAAHLLTTFSHTKFNSHLESSDDINNMIYGKPSERATGLTFVVSGLFELGMVPDHARQHRHKEWVDIIGKAQAAKKDPDSSYNAVETARDTVKADRDFIMSTLGLTQQKYTRTQPIIDHVNDGTIPDRSILIVHSKGDSMNIGSIGIILGGRVIQLSPFQGARTGLSSNTTDEFFTETFGTPDHHRGRCNATVLTPT